MSNLFTVFAPSGERFEVTKPNLTDLLAHNGWTIAPPEGAAIPAPAAAPVLPYPAPEAPVTPVEPVPSAPAPVAAPDTADELSARYAALDKDALIDLLKEEFGFEADKRTGLPKLIAKAVELELAATA